MDIIKELQDKKSDIENNQKRFNELLELQRYQDLKSMPKIPWTALIFSKFSIDCPKCGKVLKEYDVVEHKCKLVKCDCGYEYAWTGQNYRGLLE